MKFHSHTLENGLEIVAESNGEAHSTAVAFFVKTGSRDETDPVAGVSHFLEHMVFKGTPRRTADEVNREFDEMGAHYNAFTSEENTVYYASILPEQLNRAVELLSDILRPSLREEDFEIEKQVILEELAMYEDQPPFCADEKCREAFFGAHPLGRSVLGTEQSISALPVGAMREYFRAHYGPGNMVLVGTGRIDFENLVHIAKRCCGYWEPFASSHPAVPVVPHYGFGVLRKEIAAQEYVLQLAQGPAAADPERYAAKLLATILGDDSGSRLYWELIEPGRAEHACLNHYEYEGAGLMMTYMSCDPALAEENMQRLLSVYHLAETEGIEPEELQQAKNKIRSRIVLSSERPRGRLFVVGGDWLHRREYLSVRDDLDLVDSVTLDDLEAVLTRYPLSKNRTLAIGPLDTLAAPSVEKCGNLA